MKRKHIFVIILIIIAVVIAIFFTSSQKTADVNNAPPLKIFGKATIIAEILEKTTKENNIATTATIKEIKKYDELQAQEIFLEQGDNITIEFSGIGDKIYWNANKFDIRNIIQIEVRCLDGRVNSLDSFEKKDCY